MDELPKLSGNGMFVECVNCRGIVWYDEMESEFEKLTVKENSDKYECDYCVENRNRDLNMNMDEKRSKFKDYYFRIDGFNQAHLLIANKISCLLQDLNIPLNSRYGYEEPINETIDNLRKEISDIRKKAVFVNDLEDNWKEKKREEVLEMHSDLMLEIERLIDNDPELDEKYKRQKKWELSRNFSKLIIKLNGPVIIWN